MPRYSTPTPSGVAYIHLQHEQASNLEVSLLTSTLRHQELTHISTDTFVSGLRVKFLSIHDFLTPRGRAVLIEALSDCAERAGLLPLVKEIEFEKYSPLRHD